MHYPQHCTHPTKTVNCLKMYKKLYYDKKLNIKMKRSKGKIKTIFNKKVKYFSCSHQLCFVSDNTSESCDR